jgi:uncharacterized membrane protein
MNTDLARHPRLERLLAVVLNTGTWLASGVIAGGLALARTPVVTAGIAMLILLPVLRVVLMLIVFVRERDYRFAAIAGLVLTIIVLGFVLGLYVSGSRLAA